MKTRLDLQESRQQILGATPIGGAETLGEACERIVENAVFQINQRAPGYFDHDKLRYPAQAMLEEVVARLQKRV